jgi:hypothetical protein
MDKEEEGNMLHIFIPLVLRCAVSDLGTDGEMRYDSNNVWDVVYAETGYERDT